MVDVSVVVPFFNPAANLDECVESLLGQTLVRDRYEILLVDDGSTDGSAERAQHYADDHPDLVRLIRIPASGWPGRPRNVGVDAARGDYVQFVDSDDTLDPNALFRLLEIALTSNADIVVGKLSSDFRGLHHPVFRRTVVGRTLFDYPLVETLTPHKMVRRALLIENDIRFAEGPRHVEDEHFSMQIYTRAESVAVVGDLACYFYRRRRVSGRNLGDTEAVPAEYYRDLAAVLDVIDGNVEDPDARIPLQRRFYRNELLGRLRGRQMQSYTDGFRRDMFDQVRELAATRFTPAVREGLGFLLRSQSRFLVDGDLDGLTAYADWLASIKLRAVAGQPRWHDGRLMFDVEGALDTDAGPLELERDGESWAVPSAVAPGLPVADRVVTHDDLAAADIDCATVSRSDAQLWSTTEGLRLSITETGQVHVTGTVSIDPLSVRGGAALAPGLWDFRLRVMFGGLTATAPLLPAAEPEPLRCRVATRADEPIALQPYWTSPKPTLALDVAEWSRSLTDLLDGTAQPSLRGRVLTFAVPAIEGAARIPAQFYLAPLDGSPALPIQATLSVTSTGSTLHARLPRSLTGTSWQMWGRIGQPGGPAAHKLPWLLAKAGRRLELTADTSG
jgi:glycosyltransferase involved in cell wall biosynthesis